MNKIVNTLLVVVLLMFTNCKNVRVFNEYQTVNNKWSLLDTLKYNIEVKDINNPYQMSLNIRYNNSYPYRNIYLFVNTVLPDSTVVTDTLTMFLNAPDGKALGKGIGSTKEAQFVISNNLYYKETGIYSFNIVHGMRTDTIKGIEGLGLTVKKYIN